MSCAAARPPRADGGPPSGGQRPLAQGAVLARLQERRGGLVAQDREGLLQSLYLRLATGLALLVRLRLGDAALVHLGVVLQHRRQLLVGGRAVSGKFVDVLVQSLELL